MVTGGRYNAGPIHTGHQDTAQYYLKRSGEGGTWTSPPLPLFGRLTDLAARSGLVCADSELPAALPNSY